MCVVFFVLIAFDVHFSGGILVSLFSFVVGCLCIVFLCVLCVVVKSDCVVCLCFLGGCW